MAKISIQVEVEKEVHDLCEGLNKFIAAAKASLDDGWQAGTDIPVLVSAAVVDLMPVLSAIGAVKSDFAEDKKATVKALQNGLADIAFQFIK